ncbi:amino acid permease-associated region [Methanolacinia petrolearia DSM 11571]|uniref:Amino acid permease-associated region n=1 Tax=Methanolacinia petrolearia (strain DSM 11571 / OCM 486 / SEBR 4847) TaxID=679926 RepID=E1RD99_METP4|nr:amino acid permease [Methanolacinia petrolearia]ADN37082.1 amino acid permease-associated region [Methanolacinia petrolearia DSM 11571]
MTESKKSERQVLGLFTLSMIGVAAVLSLRNIPSVAEEGLGSIFYWILGAVIVFLPVAFVSAELATGWPQAGGLYIWVKEAFGDRWGFVTSWFYWIANVVWFPTILAFTAATIAYIFNPDLASNGFYTMSVILVVFWAFTIVNFFGMKVSGWVSTIGVILGTLIPGAILIIMGLWWVASGNPLEIALTGKSAIPDFSSINNVVFLVGVSLSYVGLELSSIHAREVKDPNRNYPKSIFIAVILILLIYIIATIAVAVVVPQSEISLVAGLMQAFEAFFKPFNMSWIVPLIATLTAIGAFALINTWVIGPAKAFMVTARNGDLPPVLQKVNGNYAPVSILILQAIVGSLLAFLFVLMPNVNASYWIITALTSQLYTIIYILMFAAAIRLRYSRPDVERPYKVPGGIVGLWIVAGIGLVGSLLILIVGFFPPSQIATGSLMFYEAFLFGGIILFTLIPFVIYHFRKPEWKPEKDIFLDED